MIFMKNNKKKILIVILLVMAVLFTSRTHATPLYGGYNGESETWLEFKIGGINTLLFSATVFLGVDVNDHRWAKFRISIIPFIVRLDLTYDSADIVSINFSTLLPWPIQVGTEIDIYGEGRSLWWFVVNVVTGIAGADSEDTRWAETGVPGVYGSGTDNKGNQWTWIKILNWLFGAGEDFTIDGELFLRENNSKDFEEELLSLQEDYSQTYAEPINVLLEQFTNANVMKDMVRISEKLHKRAVQLPFTQNNKGLAVVAPLGEIQSELESLSKTIKEEVFTEEIRCELQKLLNSFARDSQPQLRKISEAVKTP
jgi:hypothetical protein